MNNPRGVFQIEEVLEKRLSQDSVDIIALEKEIELRRTI